MSYDLYIPKWFDEDLDDNGGAPPAPASPVIEYRFGRPVLQPDEAWVPGAYQRFPHFRFETYQPILYRYGRDVLQPETAFAPLGYQRFPYWQVPVVTTNPVIGTRRVEFPFTSDTIVASQFGHFPYFDQTQQPAFPIIRPRVGAVSPELPVDLTPSGFYAFPRVSTTPPPPANPVLSFRMGQLPTDVSLFWQAHARYLPFPYFSQQAVPANIVTLTLLGCGP